MPEEGQVAVEPELTETEEVNPIDEIISYVMTTPHNTNPNILRQMLVTLQNSGENSQQPPEQVVEAGGTTKE